MHTPSTLKSIAHYLFRAVILAALLAGLLITGPVTPAKAIFLPDPYAGCAYPAEQSQIPEAECLALVALYDSTTGASWTTNTGWKTTATPCSWYGVTCGGGDTYVYDLLLTNNNLNGTLPTELGDFPNMQYMYITMNSSLTGAIPTELSALSNLNTLQLYGNNLSGGIPASLGGLSNLTDLHLGVNQLTGSIPPELGNLSNLQYLALYNNLLSGSIPVELGALTNVTYFHADDNDLTGSIPKELGSMSSLENLNLKGNQLSGNIPPELGNLSSLLYLSLYSNPLTGGIPSALGSLSSLTQLFLHNTQLSGSIPSELGNLSLLENLHVDYNSNLSGHLPLSFTNLTALTNLNYYSTNICTPSDSALQTWLGGVTSVTTDGTQCDLIFTDGFESGDTSAWSSTVEGPVQLGGLFSEPYLPPGLGLIVHPKAAVQGTKGLGAIVEDSHPMFVQDDTPAAETVYRARFYLLVKSLTAGNNKGMSILMAGGTGKSFQVFTGWDGAQHVVVARVGKDDRSWNWTGFYAVPTNTWTFVEIEWAAATGDGNDDGYFSLYLDGVLLETVPTLDNDTVSIDNVRMGPAYVSPGATGIIGFDAFSSDSGTYDE